MHIHLALYIIWSDLCARYQYFMDIYIVVRERGGRERESEGTRVERRREGWSGRQMERNYMNYEISTTYRNVVTELYATNK